MKQMFVLFAPETIKTLTKEENKPKTCYRPQRSWGKVIFSEACVHRGGVCPIACLDTHAPPYQRQTPTGSEAHTPTPHQRHTPPGPKADTPPPGADPPPRHSCMLEDTAKKRVVRILLECSFTCTVRSHH